MSKEIKDYLHLYLGCIGRGDSGAAIFLSADTLSKINRGDISFRPILRNLSDMTTEELELFADLNIKSDYKNVYEKQAEITRFLLSQEFDLFGLIEAGLAIDKTKTP